MTPDRLTLHVTGTDDLVVRVRATSHWSVKPDGCAAATDDGWTRAARPAARDGHTHAVARRNTVRELTPARR